MVEVWWGSSLVEQRPRRKFDVRQGLPEPFVFTISMIHFSRMNYYSILIPMKI